MATASVNFASGGELVTVGKYLYNRENMTVFDAITYFCSQVSLNINDYVWVLIRDRSSDGYFRIMYISKNDNSITSANNTMYLYDYHFLTEHGVTPVNPYLLLSNVVSSNRPVHQFLNSSYVSFNSLGTQASINVDNRSVELTTAIPYEPLASDDSRYNVTVYVYNSTDIVVKINGEAPRPPFDYKPLYNLHSSNQIFTLTTIGKTPNDGSEVILAPAEDIISWSEQSRLRDYIINLRESNRFAKMFTLNEHKYIGIKVNSYTVDGGLGYWDCTIGFYIDGVRQESLNLPILANSITDINNSWGFYFAISVDTENGACLPTIVYKDVTTGNVSYQRESYSDVEGLYEYLSPFFGATIDPENPDIPIVDPTPTTDGQTGGGGTWWTPDTPVLVPDLPSTGVTECGFMSLYKMTNTQLNALASYLWSDDFLDEVKKFFSDPMQMIISCKMLPYSVSASSTTETIQAGNVATTCTGYKIYGNNQYTKVDCGEILLPERTKTYLDYSPYCSAQIFLPFIGMRPIDVDTCVGHRIGVKYNCDCLTGQSVCFVTIDGNVAYTYECNIGMDIPISSESYHGIMGALTSALNVPLSVGTAIATGGMSVPLSGASLVSSAVGMANGSRPTIDRSGSVSGVGGFLNHRQPFLLIEYTDPIQASNQKHYMGAPTNKTIKLKNCKGLTTVEQTYLSILEATEEEKSELLDLLKGGVLL